MYQQPPQEQASGVYPSQPPEYSQGYPPQQPYTQPQPQYPPMPVQPGYPQPYPQQQPMMPQPGYPPQQMMYPQQQMMYPQQMPMQQPYMMPQQPQVVLHVNNVQTNVGPQKSQTSMAVRLLYFCFIGWWLGLFWVSAALAICCTVIGIPLGAIMFAKSGPIFFLS